jgi:DNA polymerase III delta prime subunit
MPKKKPESEPGKDVRISTATQVRRYLVDRYLADTERVADGKETRTSHILIGPPGVGKTRAVLEAAQEIAERTGRKFIVYDDKQFFDIVTGELTELGRSVLAEPEKYFVNVVFPLNLAEPTDLTGIPQIDQKLSITRFFPHFWIKLCGITPGFLVLDDFLDTQRDDTLSAGYRVILDKVLGFIPMHRDRMVIATSNTPEHSSLSRLMPVPLATRWEVHEISVPSLDEWIAWMDATFGSEGYDFRVVGFLKNFEAEGALLKLPSEPETSHPYPCPRSWTELARALRFGPADVDGIIGPEWGQKFRAFLATKVEIQDLIKDPAKWNDLKYDGKCMAVCLLASWLGKNDAKDAVPLVEEILRDSKEFVAFLAKLCPLNALTKLIMMSNNVRGVAEYILEARKKLGV